MVIGSDGKRQLGPSTASPFSIFVSVDNIVLSCICKPSVTFEMSLSLFSTFLFPLNAAKANSKVVLINNTSSHWLLSSNLISCDKLFKNIFYLFFEKINKPTNGRNSQRHKNNMF